MLRLLVARLFLLVLTLLATFIVGGVGVELHEAHGAVAVVADACECCPGVEDEDCCTWDVGACCGHAQVAVVSDDAPSEPARPPLPDAGRDALSVDFLFPRDHGPPPTPPPIA